MGIVEIMRKSGRPQKYRTGVLLIWERVGGGDKWEIAYGQNTQTSVGAQDEEMKNRRKDVLMKKKMRTKMEMEMEMAVEEQEGQKPNLTSHAKGPVPWAEVVNNQANKILSQVLFQYSTVRLHTWQLPADAFPDQTALLQDPHATKPSSGLNPIARRSSGCG